MSLPTVLVIGSLNIDLTTFTPRLPSAGETLTGTSFHTLPGGKGANQAVACARQSRSHPDKQAPPHGTANSASANVSMIGAVGADSYGPLLLSTLRDSDVDVSGVRKVEGETTGVAVIIVETDTGQNRILITPGANATLRPEDFANLPSPRPDLIVLQLEVPLETVIQIVKTAKREGVSVLLNPAPAVELPHEVFDELAHLIVNETEAAFFAGLDKPITEANQTAALTKCFAHFQELGVRQTVITLGARGCAWQNKESHEVIPAVAGIKVVDTTAAGDTFVGAYAVGVVSGVDVDDYYTHMKQILSRATMAAARSVQKRGAMDSIPWRQEADG